jgi:hypothetical protein
MTAMCLTYLYIAIKWSKIGFGILRLGYDIQKEIWNEREREGSEKREKVVTSFMDGTLDVFKF